MQGLAGLFKAPSALMFQGSFEEAKAKAVQEGKWLVSLACSRYGPIRAPSATIVPPTLVVMQGCDGPMVL